MKRIYQNSLRIENEVFILHMTDVYSFFFFLLVLLLSGAANVSSTTYDVIDFGAKPDQSVDSAQAFMNAWSAACNSLAPAVINVPEGEFLITQATFNGPCVNPWIKFMVSGTLVAPSYYDSARTQWIVFNDVIAVSIHGGVLNGNGEQLWNCKLSGGQNCPDGASSLTFNNARHITIDGLRSINSQLFHIVLLRSSYVHLRSVYIDAPENSPNTDGIHLQRSSHVEIIKANITTGDDCISVGFDSTNLLIENVFCGPGHGISIGSLGMENGEDSFQQVMNMKVINATFSGTQNGLRIKTWGTMVSGIVRNITFEDVVMVDVQHPIIIDQNYCPTKKGCPTEKSRIKINDIHYINVRGTSQTQESIYFNCSEVKPCTEIRLEDIELQYQDRQETSYCRYASGEAFGIIVPQSCL